MERGVLREGVCGEGVHVHVCGEGCVERGCMWRGVC